MNRPPFQSVDVSRRHFLQDCGIGLGKMALAGLLSGVGLQRLRAEEASGAGSQGPRAPHFPGKAKRVIHLFMAGAPSQLELFDFKPALAKLV